MHMSNRCWFAACCILCGGTSNSNSFVRITCTFVIDDVGINFLDSGDIGGPRDIWKTFAEDLRKPDASKLCPLANRASWDCMYAR